MRREIYNENVAGERQHINTWGEKKGRLLYGITIAMKHNKGSFSERLEMMRDIIELNKKQHENN